MNNHVKQYKSIIVFSPYNISKFHKNFSIDGKIKIKLDFIDENAIELKVDLKYKNNKCNKES